MKDVEFILVNDGSTDDTLTGLLSIKERFPECVIVIDKPNGGVSSARNAGIEQASREWIAFLDSDDLFADGGLSFLLNECCTEDIDILQFESKTQSYTPTQYERFTKTVLFEGFSKDYYAKSPTITVWKFLFKREYLEKHNIRFRDLRIGEDGLFIFDNCISNGKIKQVDTIVTYHIDRPGSLTTSIDSNYVRVIIKSVMYAQEVFSRYKKNNPQETGINARVTKHQERQIRFVFGKIICTPDISLSEINNCCDNFSIYGAFPIKNKQKGDDIINFMYKHAVICKLYSVAYRLYKYTVRLKVILISDKSHR